jgi:hypothetical protein
MSVAMPLPAFSKPRHGDRSYSSVPSLIDNHAQLLMNATPIRRPMTGDLDILSASQYPHGLMQPYEEEDPNPRKRKAAMGLDQFYGGIVLNTSRANSEGGHSSSAEPEMSGSSKKPKTAKRATTNDGDDHTTEKKQRGRPRLDTQDETAADRRRTQIRLAQRAYRHRKETTISALKQKVTDLQTTIEQMNKTFLTLHDNMVDAGILNSHYSLGRQLQSATEEFVTLSKIASPDSDEEEEAAIAALTKVEGKSSPEAGEKSNSRRAGVSQEPKSSSSVGGSTKKTNKRRNVSFGNHPDQNSSTDADADVEELPSLVDRHDDALLALSQTAWATDNSNIHGLNDVLSFNATIPETILYDDPAEKIIIERPLKPAHHGGSYTYSFQETTFARRLHRMCLERAFRNLTNPNIEPDYIKRAFRFTFCFSNRKRMLQRFQEMLKRRAGESLENWNVPYFHIGGAGTHYPRRDDEGNPIYPPNMVSPAKAFGPQPYIEVETPRFDANVQDMLDNIGFGGVWFDSHDVEEYLKTKGIYLDGQSSFVEVDPSVLARVKASLATHSDGSSGSDRSPLEAVLRTPSPILPAERFTDPVTDPFIAHELSELYTHPSTLFPPTTTTSSSTIHSSKQITEGPDDSWPSFYAATGTVTNTPPTASFADLLGVGTRPRSPLTFDVEMFLERMIQGSACLGRAPGFRKETIDAALFTSLQESF